MGKNLAIAQLLTVLFNTFESPRLLTMKCSWFEKDEELESYAKLYEGCQ